MQTHTDTWTWARVPRHTDKRMRETDAKSDRDSVSFWAGPGCRILSVPPGSPIPTQGPSMGHTDPQTYHLLCWAITPTHRLCPAFLNLIVPIIGSLSLVTAPRSLLPPGFSLSMSLTPDISFFPQSLAVSVPLRFSPCGSVSRCLYFHISLFFHPSASLYLFVSLCL